MLENVFQKSKKQKWENRYFRGGRTKWAPAHSPEKAHEDEESEAANDSDEWSSERFFDAKSGRWFRGA